jgi:hypothetical protein
MRLPFTIRLKLYISYFLNVSTQTYYPLLSGFVSTQNYLVQFLSFCPAKENYALVPATGE